MASCFFLINVKNITRIFLIICLFFLFHFQPNLSYYMQLQEISPDKICSTFENLIKSFKTANQRSILWSR